MTIDYFKLSSGSFEQNWSGVTVTANDWSQVQSVMGYRGDDLTTATGTNPTTITTSSGVVSLNVTASAPENYSTGGVTFFNGANPTMALAGSGTADAPYLVVHLDATGRQNLHLDVNLRDIEGGADNTNQQVAVQYRVGETGAWKNLPDKAGYVADATDAGATKVTGLHLDLPAELNGQGQVQIRFITTNAPSNDEWVGVDDIKVSSQELPGALVSVSDLSVAEGDSGDKTVTFTVTRSDTGGAFTVDYATHDGTATTAGGDYDPASGTLTFEAGGPASQTVSVTVHGDQQIEFDETFTLGLSNLQSTQGVASLLKSSGTATIENDEAVHVYDIQGAGHTSPFEGKKVVTEGVITAFDTNGFWMQDEAGDGNAATSDAVFVFTTRLDGLALGDKVHVKGTVDEYNGNVANNLTVTEIVSPTVTVLDHGHSVAATVIGPGGLHIPTAVIEDDNYGAFDPQADALDFFESIEGMLVTVKDAVAVDSTYQGATWVRAGDADHVNDRGGLTTTAGDPAPEKIEVYADSGVNPDFHPAYVMGDHLGDVTGVISYYGGQYELLPTSVGVAASQQGGVVPRETTALAGDHDHLTVAAYNVSNLDPGDTTFDRLGQDIARNLGSPDIVGLEEIQDADGKGGGSDLSGTATLQKLVDAIKAAGGPSYSFVEIAPAHNGDNGGEGGGNIRQAFLYNADRVQLVDGSLRQITDPDLANGDAYNNSRRPLVADFKFHGETVTVIDVHNYSRLGGEESMGLHQPATISGDARRIDQTTPIKDYVSSLLQQNPGAHVAVMGDFNGFYYEAAQTQLETGAGLTNLTRLLPEDERYSSIFEGASQQIDHLFVSPSLLDKAAFDIVHLNSGQLSRPSDHDPVLAQLYVNTAPTAAADAYAASENQRLVVDAAHGVLANDADANGDRLQAALVQGPADGVLTLNADGSFTYAADGDVFDRLAAGQSLTESFTYSVTDPSGEARTAVATVVVSGVADGPSQFGGTGADRLVGTALDEVLDGGTGPDTLSGGAGMDTLIGGTGPDVLDGGAGSDRLTGGAGPDRFVFTGAFGHDVVADFDSPDRIQLDRARFADFKAVLAHAQDGAGGVTITLDAADSITLLGVHKADLAAGDFVFV